jgi:hypothetical protein
MVAYAKAAVRAAWEPKRNPFAALTATVPRVVDVFAFTFFAAITGKPQS